jgi:hypothetical protein
LFVAIDFVVEFFVLFETGGVVDVVLALVLEVGGLVVFIILVWVELAGVAVVGDECLAVGLLGLVVHGLPEELI